MTKPLQYRGRRKDDGKTVVGWYVNYTFLGESIHSILDMAWDRGEYRPMQQRMVPVHPASVTQSTGLHDKNGVEIFGGDRVKGRCTRQKHQIYNRFEGVVEWSEQYAAFQITGNDSDGDLLCPMFDEVILPDLEVIPEETKGADK